MTDQLTQEQMVEVLTANEVVVTFKKLDGNERVMTCTRSMSLIPEDARPKGTQVTESTKRAENISVYDVNAKGWRSFKYANVISFDVT